METNNVSTSNKKNNADLSHRYEKDNVFIRLTPRAVVGVVGRVVGRVVEVLF